MSYFDDDRPAERAYGVHPLFIEDDDSFRAAAEVEDNSTTLSLQCAAPFVAHSITTNLSPIWPALPSSFNPFASLTLALGKEELRYLQHLQRHEYVACATLLDGFRLEMAAHYGISSHAHRSAATQLAAFCVRAASLDRAHGVGGAISLLRRAAELADAAR